MKFDHFMRPHIMFEGEGAQGGGIAAGGTPPGSGPGVTSTPIPDHFKDNPALKDIKDFEGLMKTYESAQSMIGKTRLPLPGADATPEAWKEFHTSIGAPDSPDKYNMTLDQYPEGVVHDQKMEDAFRGVFGEIGLRQDQVTKIVQTLAEFQGGQVASMGEASDLQVAEWEQESKKQFGKAYDETISLGQRAVGFINDPELSNLLIETGLAHHPAVTKAFSTFGKMIAEHRGEGGEGASFNQVMSPDSAKQELTRLRADKDFMTVYMEAGNSPQKRAAMEKMNKLLDMAHPNNRK